MAVAGILVTNFFEGDHEPQNVNFSNNNNPSSTTSSNSQKSNIASNISGEPIENDNFEIPNGIRVSSISINSQLNRIAHSLFPDDWIKNRYGAYLWDNSAVDQASTRAGWEYVGTELPPGVNRYNILTEVDGNLYHKNTGNTFARIGNFLGGNFVEHKSYTPATERGLNESIVTGGGYAAGGLALRGFSGIAAKTGSKLTIQFGKGANQVSHAFRHTDAVGLNRAVVKSAVETHIRGVSSQIVAGKPFNQLKLQDNGFNTQLLNLKMEQ